MFAWCLQPEHHHIYFQYAICQWKIKCQKCKRPQIHSVMAFSSFTNMDSYTFILPTISLCTDWWCLPGFYNQIIVYLPTTCYWSMINIFQHSKISQIHLLMVFTSITKSYTSILSKISLCTDWWCLFGVYNQSIVIITFNILLVNGKTFFRSQRTISSCSYGHHQHYKYM